jgi:apyrase
VKKIIGCFILGFVSISGCAEDWRDSCTYQICEAIIDAGSSGSRLYIYGHDVMDLHSRHVLYTQKITPGLDSVELRDLPAYFKKLVPQSPYTPMPIFVYGTAGMRLISQEAQQARYDLVQNWFKNYPTWSLKEARTITGQEEGIFAWVAAQTELNLWGKGFEHLKSVIEMGGASVQVNVPVHESQLTQLNPQDVYKVHWKNQDIYVWSKSYIGLGINEVEKKIQMDAQCFSEGYPLGNGDVAHGDIQHCIDDLEQHNEIKLLEQLKDKHVLPISEHGWVALGAIRYSVQSKFYQYQQYFDLKHLFNDGNEKYCHQKWNHIQDGGKQDAFAYRGCLSASYIYAFLKDGLGIDELHQVYYPTDSEPIDWTLGALLLENQN